MNMLLILIKYVIILIITLSKHDIKFACNVQTHILYAMFNHILYNVSNIQTDVWAILTIRNLIQFGQPSGQFADRFFLQVTHFDIRNRHGAEGQNAQQYYIKLHSVITNNVIKFKRNTQRIYSNLDIYDVYLVNRSDFFLMWYILCLYIDIHVVLYM